MNNFPRQKLCELIATYGQSLCDDPRRCEGLLRDFCGEHKREINVLVGALKERVAAGLLASSPNVPHEVLIARLIKQLQDNLALTEDAARWAVESWALAYLDEFYIDKYLVTNAQFERFVKATGYKAEGDWWRNYTHERHPVFFEKHPVVKISWNDASAYCKWAGKRLPIEAEWEKAARGTDGRIWPWGDMWDKSKCGELHLTTPVGSYPAGASPYGVMDMVGSVWEWCADWYDEDYYANSPQRNPQGPSSGTMRVLRGGAWLFDLSLLCARRLPPGLIPSDWGDLRGFRCCLSPRIPR